MEHRSLLSDISRFTQGVAEGPVQVKEAWCVRRNRDFFYESQTYGRYAPGFDFPGQQSHGPRADWSGGDQQSQINTRLANSSRNLFDCRHQPPGTAHQTETIVILG